MVGPEPCKDLRRRISATTYGWDCPSPSLTRVLIVTQVIAEEMSSNAGHVDRVPLGIACICVLALCVCGVFVIHNTSVSVSKLGFFGFLSNESQSKPRIKTACPNQRKELQRRISAPNSTVGTAPQPSLTRIGFDYCSNNPVLKWSTQSHVKNQEGGRS